MWSSVSSLDSSSPAPSARSKHSATLVGEHVYLLGGRNGNLPLKDFWQYNLVTGKWTQLKPAGDKLPALQEHSAVFYRDYIYVFGGEVGFSAGTEVPLWTYDIKNNSWKKFRTKKGVASPKGRRGHTALIHRGNMLIFGGYQDLKGSLGEMWAFHFDTESWHLLSSSQSKGGDSYPPPRHKHSAIIYEEAMWIYGGMTDLQERSDLWKYDLNTKQWFNIKTKINPGPLHSHAACRLPSSMVVFGGEKGGHSTNELWKFSFSVESWEKVNGAGQKPSPRAECVAFTVSELLLKDQSANSLETKTNRIRLRTCNSADRNRHSSYFPSNKVQPSEQTYVFNASQDNYVDGSALAQQYSESRNSRSLLQEISKFSQNINISRLNNKCNYSVLSGVNTDSTESLLKQHATLQNPDNELNLEEASPNPSFTTPTKAKLVKSKSAFVIKRRDDNSPSGDVKDGPVKKRVEFDPILRKIPREPISVPNFSLISLPTPILTPVEATKLVYLDTDEENDLEEDNRNNQLIEKGKKNTVKRGESYSSHLGYADNPLYEHMANSKLPKTISQHIEENVSSTSDYCSIETVNRLSSASNYSVKTPQDENQKNKEKDKHGPFGFCNPNYLGPIIDENQDKKKAVKILNDPEKENINTSEEDILEMQNCNENFNRNTKVFYRHSARVARPPKSLSIDGAALKTPKIKDNKFRALSASGADRKNSGKGKKPDPYIPMYVYIVGGKEHGQVTVFQRPISIWKFKLF